MLVVKPSWSAAGFGDGASLAAAGGVARLAVAFGGGASSDSVRGASLAATGGATRLAVALGGGASSVAVGGEARMTAGGNASTSGDGVGRVSESGGASEVWHLALSSSQKWIDKIPMANSAAFFIRIRENRFGLKSMTEARGARFA